ncbi:hypothetical protein TCAL_09512 [Tigriopus californicus]|uniref:Uncharacterized protein n=1 Tax=Tigriopus californicus TaxID=6832 RepID=A0A553PAS0_TIGCA|nr:uncharacterized protein LOC131877094 [Tigriopus californicus]TRY74777.1 hypothetical protein TCAL_09512 [Tigriopus californicus]|eukprot:TCALIF_09512-PA protein Name:"Similar to DMC1 Meiotic recombination protein DMC1/LIM15 homolog (Homo sapiens)" AED:0.44 eAED:0.44 QI:30/0/0.5/1/1/1/2/0/141
MEQGGNDDFITDVGLLQAHGFNVAGIKKLKMAGIYTVRGVQMIKKKLCGSAPPLSQTLWFVFREFGIGQTPGTRVGIHVDQKRSFNWIRKTHLDSTAHRLIADRFSLDQESVLDNGLYAGAYCLEQEMDFWISLRPSSTKR